jgi:hypothetical protein
MIDRRASLSRARTDRTAEGPRNRRSRADRRRGVQLNAPTVNIIDSVISKMHIVMLNEVKHLADASWIRAEMLHSVQHDNATSMIHLACVIGLHRILGMVQP